MSERSPTSNPSSASSPSFVEVKPEGSRSPPAAPGFPFTAGVQPPYSSMSPPNPPSIPSDPPTSPPDPHRIVRPGGTAVYERPPSLELPRALNNERANAPQPARKASVSSMKAEVDDAEQPTSSQRRHKPNISIDSTLRPSTPSFTPSVESPGLSSLPRVSSLRRDSGRDVPRRDSKRPEWQRPDSGRQRRHEDDRHRREQDDSQERLERDPLAESDRRQSPREGLTRTERHRRDAAAALEGQPNDPLQENLEAEFAQMARERVAAEQRRRESDASERYAEEARRYAEDASRRETEDRDRYGPRRRSPTATRSQRLTRDSFNYPPSPAPARSSTFPVAVHQYPSRRRNSTIRERGEEVIAREQARAATQQLSNAMGGMNLDDRDRDDGFELVDGHEVGESEEARRRRRRDERRERRERRPRPVYK